ncbi:hypothetical protein MSAN_01045300 [Mycena sanguinolenta]|uniref:F-box domain-containing protein n=1 Tax=Mycena sanguinolenta TaxID=230812 RepID=A0A8H6YMH5_9AGAR|nr:hypothetical protein MSAN_01045300 [Mycena sanguinolenta]
MPLDHLDDDVLFLILDFTDVYTILSLSRVNRYLNRISCSRQVWIAVVLDLSSRHLIDLPLDAIVENSSTEELKDEVKRVVVGPRTWSHTSMEPPTLLRRKIVPIPETDNSAHGYFESTAYIITYVDELNHGDAGEHQIQCLEAHTGRIVWSWARLGHVVFEAKCDFRGRYAVLAFVSSTPDTGEYHILILEIDLKTGDSRELLAIDGLLDTPFELRICGNYCACETLHNNCALLINWSTSQFIVLRSAIYPLSYGVELCSQHMLLTYGGRNPYLHLYSFGLFDSLWAPISQLDLNALINCIDLPPSLVLELPGIGVRYYAGLTRTTLLESPIHADTYELILEIVNFRRRRGVLFRRLLSWFHSTPLPPAATLHNGKTLQMTTRAQYRLTFGSISSFPGQSESPQLSVQSVVRHSRSFQSFTSRAGYGLWYGGPRASDAEFVVQRLDSIGSTKPLKIPLPDVSPSERPYDMRLTHSGAVLAMYRSKMVVSHYL